MNERIFKGILEDIKNENGCNAPIPIYEEEIYITLETTSGTYRAISLGWITAGPALKICGDDEIVYIPYTEIKAVRA